MVLPQYTHLWYERRGKKAHTINQLLKEKVRQKSLPQTRSEVTPKGFQRQAGVVWGGQGRF